MRAPAWTLGLLLGLFGGVSCRRVTPASTPGEAVVRYVQAVQQGDVRSVRALRPPAENDRGDTDRTLRALALWVAFFLVFVVGGFPLYLLLRWGLRLDQPVPYMVGGMVVLAVVLTPLLRGALLGLVERLRFQVDRVWLDRAAVEVLEERPDTDPPFVVIRRSYPDGAEARDTVWVVYRDGGWVIRAWSAHAPQRPSR
ncbi:MAG: hypothetical protein L3J76_02830 [Candidatus Hydrothermae bacterium]|nr:hypothetical protein [Candidatus Hydrothermae bacterium]